MREDEWIERLLARFALPARPGRVGPGDDAAVFPVDPGDAVVATLDSMVEGTHIHAGWLGDADLGRRILLIGLSDLAAMGAEPRGALLGIEARELPGPTGEEFWSGVAAVLRTHGLELLGGNVTRTTGPLALTSTLLGTLPAGSELLRSGARPGDDVWVTGRPGAAARARRLLV